MAKLALISTATLSSATTLIQIQNIPQTYQTLVMRGLIRTDQASTVDAVMRFQLNNNGASTYTTAEIIGQGSLGYNYNSLSTSGRNEYIVGSSANTSAHTIFEYRIEDYTGSQDKRIAGWSVSVASGSAGNMTHSITRTSFSAATTEMSFFVLTGNIVANSKLWLFGLPAS
jgi:hypothetical protein